MPTPAGILKNTVQKPFGGALTEFMLVGSKVGTFITTLSRLVEQPTNGSPMWTLTIENSLVGSGKNAGALWFISTYGAAHCGPAAHV